jgi:hypothetical protein
MGHHIDKPTPTIIPIYDFFEVATYIAFHEGYVWDSPGNRDNWYRDVLSEMEYPGNDCYVTWFVGSDDFQDYAQPLREFDEGLRKHFGLKPDDTILLNISW